MATQRAAAEAQASSAAFTGNYFRFSVIFCCICSLYWVGMLSLYLHNAMQFIDVVTSWGTLPAPLGRSALDPQ